MKRVYFKFKIYENSEHLYNRAYYFDRLALIIRQVAREHFVQEPYDKIRMDIGWKKFNIIHHPLPESVVMKNTEQCPCYMISDKMVDLEHALAYVFRFENVLLFNDCTATMEAVK